MIRRIHHVQITIPVGREDEGRAFYCGLLGMRELPKPITFEDRGGLWLLAGSDEFHIGVEDGVDRAATKGHVALQVDDVRLCMKKLQDAGVNAAIAKPEYPGYFRIKFRDPFGNLIELIQPS